MSLKNGIQSFAKLQKFYFQPLLESRHISLAHLPIVIEYNYLKNGSKFNNKYIKFQESNEQKNGHNFGKSFRIALPIGVVTAIFIGHIIDIKQNNKKSLCESSNNKYSKTNPKVHLSHGYEKKSITGAIKDSKDLAQRIKDEVGSPGMVVSVSIDGQEVWSEGLGFSDVENRIPCNANTVMRIASISKSITMAAVAKLWQENKLDLDKPVQQYVTAWPKKTFKGEEVSITTRQLVSHMAGIRHYHKDCGRKRKREVENRRRADILKDEPGQKKATDAKDEKEKINEKSKEDKISEFELEEYYIKQRYESMAASLALFKDDILCSKPGSEFLYTTHGWTLVSAVVQGASGRLFTKVMKNLFRDLGLKNTFLDENQPLIYNRARQYVRNKLGKLVNAPYVDNSYKWAGGGFLSTAGDLVKFGNAMLYSYQNKDGQKADQAVNDSKETQDKRSVPGYLSPKTMLAVWSPVEQTECSWDKDGAYAMGWAVVQDGQKHGCCKKQRFYVSHTGGAIGGSSVLLILPRSPRDMVASSAPPPKGIVVAILVNMQAVGLNKLALEIAKIFEQVDTTL